MLNNESRIARVEKSLRWFEQDIVLLNLRVKELSPERQELARRFAEAVISEGRAELEKLLEERPNDRPDQDEVPCEPAD